MTSNECYAKWASGQPYQPTSRLFSGDIVSIMSLYEQITALDFCGGDPTGRFPPSRDGSASLTSSYVFSQLLADSGKNYSLDVVDAFGNQPDNQNIHFFPGNAQQIIRKFDAGKYNIITCINAIQEPSIDESVIRELYNTACENGRMFFTVPGKIGSGVDLVALIDGHVVKQYETLPRRYDEDSFRNMKYGGWGIESISKINSDLVLPRSSVAALLQGRESDARRLVEENLRSAGGKSKAFGENLLSVLNLHADELILPSVFWKVTLIKQ